MSFINHHPWDRCYESELNHFIKSIVLVLHGLGKIYAPDHLKEHTMGMLNSAYGHW